MGDLLRIDLTTRTTSEETIPPELIRGYIGAKGLGTHYLLNEVGSEVDPLGPQNKLIFATGPLSGTRMMGANRYAVYFASPLTGGYGECYSGGNLTPQFAATGYRLVVVEGAADGPVFLEISDEGARIHPAGDVWGLDAYEAEERLLAKVEAPKKKVCAIGPAGENLVRFACINNERWHHLARGGPGTVMGSKRVKGIVWHGTRKPSVARPEEFDALCRDMIDRGKDDPGVAAYKRGGTVNMVRILNGASTFPTRYWQRASAEYFEGLTTEHMLETTFVKNQVCPPCMLQCVKRNVVKEGPLAGLEIDGPEYETIYVFGGLCEIRDWTQVMRMNDICDRLGMDTMSAGNLAALAIEACQQGRLGIGLEYGDADGVAEFLEMMARRKGVGDLFAEGILAVEKELGLEGVAVHVKGMEPAGYDARKLKGMGLSFVTAARGACHLRSTFYKAELAGLSDPAELDGKAAMLVDWEDRLCIMDTLIYCRFYRDLVQWPYLTAVVNAAVGTDYSEEELRAVAARIIAETHRFNELRGFGAERERLPAWITERPVAAQDGSELRVSQDEMERLRRDYYAERGWDYENSATPESTGA
ncbi:MAG TPA: aldehyde ferredoxin oxidoreductase family protein [Thermoleophilia bacterium]|nr:aldehyde ferredoxin oxidoreductase family protein [Thermoleophilia bacterium]